MTNRTELLDLAEPSEKFAESSINLNSSREKLRGVFATNLATDDVAEQHPAHLNLMS
jgi:hypothetical protein